MIENIIHNKITLAIILRTQFVKNGIEFFTPSEFSQQLAYMKRPTGYIIQPHVHNPVCRQIQYTKEVIFIKSGSVRIDFYDDNLNYLESSILNTGDFILLAFGGHGFEILAEAEMIEVKQGPYAGEQDKTRFPPVAKNKIMLKEIK